MVIARLSGGLGNQLFQYACGRHLAIKRHEELVLDLSWFIQPHLLHSSRKFELNHFFINANIASFNSSLINSLSSNLYLRRIFGLLLAKESVIEGVDNKNIYELNRNKDIILKGYWQSQNYFLGIRNILLKEISPKCNLSQKYFDLKIRIEQAESIAIHIRRGDYVNNSRSTSLHGVLPASYYLNALEYMLSNTKHSHFFVFSDDISWVKNCLDFKGVNHTFIEGMEIQTTISEFDLIRCCRHHIIANSSFSWWGAWLGASTNQIVIAPKQWYATRLTPPNLLPPQWIQMDY
jgi:hypothetical protein